MSEAFVDLSYRGLSLGRRIKLTRVQPASGYLETPAPMPVGTSIAIASEDGVTLEATVTHVHEQVGGATAAPGMQVTPKLEGEAIVAWWDARVASSKAAEEAAAAQAAQEQAAQAAAQAQAPVIIAPSTPPPPGPAPSTPPPPGPAPTDAPARPERVTVRPRSHTVPTPPPAGAVPDAAEWQSDLGKAAAAVASAMSPAAPKVHPSMDHGATTVMQAVDPAALGLEETRSTGEHSVPHAIVDDGQKTTVMSAIDPATLGLEVTESGRFVAATDETDSGAVASGDDKKPGNGGSKKRKKRKG